MIYMCKVVSMLAYILNCHVVTHFFENAVHLFEIGLYVFEIGFNIFEIGI